MKKRYDTKRIVAEFPRRNWSIASVNRLLLSEALCKNECTAAGSVTLKIRNNDCLRNGTSLTSVSLTEQSASGNSDCIAVSVRKESDTWNIRFKRSV